MSKQKMIRVVIVEDDRRIRNTLIEVLASSDYCECIGAFSTGLAAVSEIPQLAPDVILMDINLPDLSGVECVAKITPTLPKTQILMLTVYQNPEMIFSALAAGAHGYLLKPVLPEHLLKAVREIREGGVPMSPTIARKVLSSFHQRPNGAPVDPVDPMESGVHQLGPREKQVLDFLVMGYSYKEIASELNIGVSTVGTYVQRIYEKLHVRSRRDILSRYGSPLR